MVVRGLKHARTLGTGWRPWEGQTQERIDAESAVSTCSWIGGSSLRHECDAWDRGSRRGNLAHGCNTYKPGGALQSHDTFTYFSEAHTPVTVTVVDTRTKEAIFVNEVPVGKQLVIRFYDEQNDSNVIRPAAMHGKSCHSERPAASWIA